MGIFLWNKRDMKCIKGCNFFFKLLMVCILIMCTHILKVYTLLNIFVYSSNNVVSLQAVADRWLQQTTHNNNTAHKRSRHRSSSAFKSRTNGDGDGNGGSARTRRLSITNVCACAAQTWTARTHGLEIRTPALRMGVCVRCKCMRCCMMMCVASASACVRVPHRTCACNSRAALTCHFNNCVRCSPCIRGKCTLYVVIHYCVYRTHTPKICSLIMLLVKASQVLD